MKNNIYTKLKFYSYKTRDEKRWLFNPTGMFQTTLHERDHALLLHHRNQHEVDDVTQCAERCRDDSRCVAFNFQHSASSSVRQCELKDATRQQDPDNYIKRRGYTYYEDVAFR